MPSGNQPNNSQLQQLIDVLNKLVGANGCVVNNGLNIVPKDQQGKSKQDAVDNFNEVIEQYCESLAGGFCALITG